MVKYRGEFLCCTLQAYISKINTDNSVPVSTTPPYVLVFSAASGLSAQGFYRENFPDRVQLLDSTRARQKSNVKDLSKMREDTQSSLTDYCKMDLDKAFR